MGLEDNKQPFQFIHFVTKTKMSVYLLQNKTIKNNQLCTAKKKQIITKVD